MPETQVEVLLTIIKKLVFHNPTLAGRLIFKALEFIKHHDDKERQEEIKKELLSEALKISPEFCMTVFKKNPVKGNQLVTIVSHVLNEFSINKEEKIGSEQFLRWEWEILLWQKERNFPEIYWKNRLGQIVRGAYSKNSEEKCKNNHEKPSKQWLAQIPELLLFCRNLTKKVNEHPWDFTKALGYLLRLDMDLYLKVIRAPEIYETLETYSMPVKELRLELFKSDIDELTLLLNLRVIEESYKKEKNDGMKIYRDFIYPLAAASAMVAPSLCCEILLALDPVDYTSFLRQLENFSPAAFWNDQHIRFLLHILESAEDPGRLAVTQLRLLAWIGPNKGNISGLVHQLIEQCESLKCGYLIEEAADAVLKIDEQSGNKLLTRALIKATENQEVYSITDIIGKDRNHSLDAEIKRKALIAARDACINTDEKYRLATIVKQLALLDVKEAIITIQYFEENSIEINPAINNVVEYISIKSEENIENWIDWIEGVRNLNQRIKRKLICSIVEAAIDSGAVKSFKFIEFIEEPTTKVSTMLDLLKHGEVSEDDI